MLCLTSFSAEEMEEGCSVHSIWLSDPFWELITWTPATASKPRTNVSVHQKRLKFTFMHPSVAEMVGQFSSEKHKANNLRNYYIFSNVLITKNILVASLHLSVQTAAVNPKLMKLCALHFLNTLSTQLFEIFPTYWHCKIIPSQNFRLSSPILMGHHNQFWFQINCSNFISSNSSLRQ